MTIIRRKPRTHHAGIVHIDESAILRLLRFEGGKIHYIGRPPEYLTVSITIEHPDMPEVPEDGEIPIVEITVQDNTKYYRIDPKPGWRYRLCRKYQCVCTTLGRVSQHVLKVIRHH